jgi:hypothetical protein
MAMFSLGTRDSLEEDPMRHPKRMVKIFTVVDVWRGMASSTRSFRRLASAKSYIRRLRRDRNLCEDDVQLFEDILSD